MWRGWLKRRKRVPNLDPPCACGPSFALLGTATKSRPAAFGLVIAGEGPEAEAFARTCALYIPCGSNEKSAL